MSPVKDGTPAPPPGNEGEATARPDVTAAPEQETVPPEGWAPPDPGDPRPGADLAALAERGSTGPVVPAAADSDEAGDPREPARTQEAYEAGEKG